MSWIAGICLTCIGGSLVRLCIPQDAKSGVGKALRFLSSLILLLGVISPFLSPLPEELPLPQMTVGAGETVDAAVLLLEKSTDRIRRDVQTAFPETAFTLSLDRDTEEMQLIVSCSDEREGKLLCSYIEAKYQLPCQWEERT